MKQLKHKLPNNVSPVSYNLHFEPNLKSFEYIGKETILLTITSKVKKLTLHSLDLKILNAQWKSGNKNLIAKKVIYNKQNETVSFDFGTSLSGKGKLILEFSGVIIDGLQGFYRSKYTHNKQDKYLATTQLEATDARRFFPCFDEPAHKATFKVSTVIPKHLQVISNTVESKILPHHDPSLKIVHFESTPKMSTYLLALIIGELEHAKTVSKRGVEIRVHTTHGKKSQTKFALDVTKRALDFLEDYFGIPYPLPVLDLIAIPDFAAGAMENWGAITFRETALLVDEEHTTFIGRQRVAEVIAHELVHQWFGNLVTMEWWTHLWLNESFATYMAYLTVDKLFPEWNIWTKFVLQEQSIALHKDALHTSQPIEVEVKLPSEISESFDPAIVYAKGASVIRMLAGFIGPDNFKTGLSVYLKKHSYKNTQSIHLWDAFEKASGKPVRQFMKTWTQKVGYPVIDVALSTQGGKKYLTTSQTRFNQLVKRLDRQLWSVPLLPIYTGPAPKSELVLTKSHQKFEVSPNFQLDKLNKTEEGFYIVNYSPELLANIIIQLRDKTLSSTERLAIVRNSILLAKSGHIPTSVFLEIIKFLEDEDSYIVWSEVSTGLNQLASTFFGTKVLAHIEKIQQQLFGSLILRKDLGFYPKFKESYNNKTLRALAFLGAGLSGHALSVKTAKDLFKKKSNGKKIDADLRYPVYAIIAKHGSASDYQKLITLYRETGLAQEQQQILLALTHFTNPDVQKKVLKFLFSDEVRDQNRDLALSHALNSSSLKMMAWKEIKSNWAILEQKFGANKLLGRIISGASSFNTTQEYKDFVRFTKTRNLKNAKQTTAQTLEKIEIKMAWKIRDLGQISKYFTSAGGLKK